MLINDQTAMVRSSKGDCEFFYSVIRVLKGVTLAQLMRLIFQDDVLLTLINLKKENCFTLRKGRSRQYPVKTMTSIN